ncbi:MAG: DevR family CRISPR-associated autoregulator, partial [Chloroflexus sp.]
MTTPLYSLSISARAILDMHSLNNEGGEGNQIQTRMVNIVDQNGQLQNVNAISGDMFKHIQAEHLFHIARENPALPLCAGCREFNANRINADSDFITNTKGLSDAETLDAMLQTCAMDDIEGILITEGG